MNNLLNKIYYNPSNPASFSSAEKVLIEARKTLPTIKRKDVENWLSKQLVATLHKPVRKNFKRNPVIAEHINENFQADLVDMKEFKNVNKNFTFILTVIDVFSKKAYAVPLKNKSAESVSKAFESILKTNVPTKLQTDNGLEFLNSSFKKLMKTYDINHFTSNNSDIKCSIIERFNKTLKSKMFKYFTNIGKRNYIEVLPQLITSYNNTYHRSIKMTPNQVTELNENEVFRNLYKVENKRALLKKFNKPKLALDDTVRLKYDSSKLDRSYYPNWTDATFKIKSKLKQINPLYTVVDEKNKPIKQRFYDKELQKIANTGIYRVEKILKERKVNNKKQYFVKWLNHDNTHNSWIEANQLLRNGK